MSSNCSSQEGGEEGCWHQIQQRRLSRVKLNHHDDGRDKAEDVGEYLRVEVNLLALGQHLALSHVPHMSAVTRATQPNLSH